MEGHRQATGPHPQRPGTKHQRNGSGLVDPLVTDAMHGMPYQVDTYKLLIATYAKMGLLQVGTWVGVLLEVCRRFLGSDDRSKTSVARKVYML